MHIRTSKTSVLAKQAWVTFFFSFFLAPLIILIISKIVNSEIFSPKILISTYIGLKPTQPLIFYGLILLWIFSFLALTTFLYFRAKIKKEEQFSDIYFNENEVLLVGANEKTSHVYSHTSLHLTVFIGEELVVRHRAGYVREGISNIELSFYSNGTTSKISILKNLRFIYKIMRMGKRFHAFSYDVSAFPGSVQEKVIKDMMDFYYKNNSALFFPPKATIFWVIASICVLGFSIFSWIQINLLFENIGYFYLLPVAILLTGLTLSYMTFHDILLKRKALRNNN